MQTPSTIIQIEGLTRTFKEVTALDQISLRIKQGELFGLVGPDGAGKTTILRILAGLLDITEGSVSVLNFDMSENYENVKSKIGYMAQQFSLYSELTVSENLAFFAEIFNVPENEIEDRSKSLLDFAGLSQFTSRRAGKLSGGMQKKLALACSMIHSPLLLLDEPTNGVDPVSRREFWDILTELHLQGTSILVSTPYMDEAERCTQVGLLYQGKLILCDQPHKIMQSMQADLLEIQAEDYRSLIPILQKMKGIQEVQTYGELLRVFVDNASKRIPEIKKEVHKDSVQLSSIRQTLPRMEDVFISTIHRLEQ